MVADEKDRFGDKLRDAERGREDQYFAQRDRELIAKLKHTKEGQEEAVLKQAAHMRCPKCGSRLRVSTRHAITVDACDGCGGIWLDRGELERLAARETEDGIARWVRSLTGG
jgi:hypothetical protein